MATDYEIRALVRGQPRATDYEIRAPFFAGSLENQMPGQLLAVWLGSFWSLVRVVDRATTSLEGRHACEASPTGCVFVTGIAVRAAPAKEKHLHAVN